MPPHVRAARVAERRSLTGMAVAHPQVSPQDFAALMASPEWDRRVEHLAGEIVVNPSPSPRHQLAEVAVVRAVGAWQDERGDGGLLLPAVSILVGEDSPIPDLSYWEGARRPALGTGRIDDPVPDLVVEIASPRTVSNDRGLKRDAYLRAGVREQWRLDPSDRTAIVVDAGGTQRALASGERLVSAVLRGFSVPVGRLFGDA